MGFEHDIFIAYAPSSGNENQVAATWSLKFCDYLALLMNRLSDRKLNFLSHDDLRVRQSVLGEKPGNLFSNTAVYIIILSPEYVKSKSYMQELGGTLRLDQSG